VDCELQRLLANERANFKLLAEKVRRNADKTMAEKPIQMLVNVHTCSFL